MSASPENFQPLEQPPFDPHDPACRQQIEFIKEISELQGPERHEFELIVDEFGDTDLVVALRTQAALELFEERVRATEATPFLDRRKPPKLPALDARRTIRALNRAGFVKDHSCGSHAYFVHPETGAKTGVAIHSRKTFGAPILRLIASQAGMTAEELFL